MLLGTRGASLLGILLTGKGTVRAGEGFLSAGDGIKKKNSNSREFVTTSFNNF